MNRNALLIATTLLAASFVGAAEAYTWGNVRFEGGGFVDGILPSRTQPGLVYARTDVGGAYRWDSTGGKWIPLLDWISEKNSPLFGTEALALDPHDSKRLYVLCGMHYNSSGKTMILRSFDYGATFDTVNVSGQFKAHGNGYGRQSGEKLAVDPQNSAILFCGTRMAGLWKSGDTGRTWVKVSTISAASDTNFSNLLNNNGISFVLFDSASGKAANGVTKTIYVGATTNATSSLYASQDGGATFTPVPGAPAQMAMRAVLGGGNLYVTYSASLGPQNLNGGSVWKLAIASGTWTDITPKEDNGFAYASGHDSYGYAIGGITTDPKNPLRLVLSTMGCYAGSDRWPTAGKGNAGEQFFLTVDGGATWTPLMPSKTDDGTDPNLDPNGNNWIEGSNIHWGGDVEFDPFDSRVVWVGSGNGVFRTDDVNASTVVWKFQSRGIEETVPLDIVSVPGGPLVTAMYDYDGATYSDITASVPAHPHPVGSSTSLGYSAGVGGFLRSGRVTDYSVNPSVTYDVLYHSTDKGFTWTATDTSTLPGSGGNLAMSADGRAFLLRPSNLHNGSGASASSFYRSVDGGKSWKAATGLSTQSGRMVADPVNPANFYIVPDGYTGDVYGSTDTGATFSEIGTLAGSNQYSASSGMLRAAPGAAGDLWICLDAEQTWNASGYSSNGLAHSTDGGKTWTRINTMDGCLSIGLGKAAPNAGYYALYMWGAANGGPRGIYRSIDKGATWERINDDGHQYGGPANGNFVVGDWNVYGRVYMSTAGRGIVYGNIGAVTAGLSAVSRHSAAASLVRVGSGVRVDASGFANLRLELCGADGRIFRSQAVEDGQSVALSGFPRGILFARLTSDGHRVASRTVVRN